MTYTAADIASMYQQRDYRPFASYYEHDDVCRRFRNTVRISNGMGFTNDGIFIPPDIVRSHDLQDDKLVSGRAVINVNKKKRSWGWRALTIEVVQDT